MLNDFKGKIPAVGKDLGKTHGMLLDHNAHIQQVIEALMNEKRSIAPSVEQAVQEFCSIK